LSSGSGDAALAMTRKKLDDDKNHHLTQSINKWFNAADHTREQFPTIDSTDTALMMTMQKPNSTAQSPMEKKSSDIRILKDESEIDYQNPIGSLSLFQNMVNHLQQSKRKLPQQTPSSALGAKRQMSDAAQQGGQQRSMQVMQGGQQVGSHIMQQAQMPSGSIGMGAHGNRRVQLPQARVQIHPQSKIQPNKVLIRMPGNSQQQGGATIVGGLQQVQSGSNQQIQTILTPQHHLVPVTQTGVNKFPHRLSAANFQRLSTANVQIARQGNKQQVGLQKQQQVKRIQTSQGLQQFQSKNIIGQQQLAKSKILNKGQTYQITSLFGRTPNMKQLPNQPQKAMMVQKAGIKIKNEPGSSRRNSKVMEKGQQQKQVRSLSQISTGKQFGNNPVSTVTLNVANANQQKVLLAQLNSGGMVLQQPQNIKQRVFAQQGGRQQVVSSKGKTLQYNPHIIGSSASQIIQTSGVPSSINQAVIRQRRPATSSNININQQNKIRHQMSQPSHVVLPPQQMIQRVSSHSQQSSKNLQQSIQVTQHQPKTYQIQSPLNNINMLPNPQFASPNQIIKLQPNPIPTSIENDNKEE